MFHLRDQVSDSKGYSGGLMVLREHFVGKSKGKFICNNVFGV